MFFRILNLKIWEVDPILIPMESRDQNKSLLALYRERIGSDEKNSKVVGNYMERSEAWLTTTLPGNPFLNNHLSM